MTTNTPEGWKLVPIKPSQEMIGQGIIAYDGKCESAYRAMLAAAPSPPTMMAGSAGPLDQKPIPDPFPPIPPAGRASPTYNDGIEAAAKVALAHAEEYRQEQISCGQGASNYYRSIDAAKKIASAIRALAPKAVT